MATSRKDIRDWIKAHIHSHDFGRGHRYVVYLNDERLYINPMQSLNKMAEPGDSVYIKVYRGHWYVGDMEFTVEPPPDWVAEEYDLHINRERRYRGPRDYQRQRVYDAEYKMRKRLGTKESLSLEDAQAFVDRICADYGVESPTVRINGRRSTWSIMSYWRELVDVAPGWGTRPDILAHEIAHWIAYKMGADDMHGPNFVQVACTLYHDYLGWDWTVMHECLDELGVNY